MPTQYSFTLPTPGATTGKRTRIPYLIARAIDPATRDFLMRGSTWELGSPALEIVLMTLATPLGTYLPDLTLGPDYGLLQKQAKTVRQDWKDSVEKALARFIPSVITDLRVEVDPPIRGQIKYLVEFVDPRANDKTPVKLPLVA